MPSRAPPHQPTSPTYLPSLQSHLKETTSLAHALPRPSDIAFHRSVDPKLAVRLDEASGRVWGVLQGLLSLVDGLKEEVGAKTAGGSSKGKKRVREEEGLVDEFERDVGEGVDLLLERADTCMDNYTGKLPPPSIPIIPTETARSKHSSINTTGVLAPTGRLPSSITNASIAKPQVLFPVLPDQVELPSSSTEAYKTYSSTLTPSFVKHHAQVSIDHTYPSPSSPTSPLPPATPSATPTSRFPIPPPHPYTYELAHIPYPSSLTSPTASSPTPPASFEDTPFTYVTTLDGLREMIARLETETHVAIDLEHHSFRTYGGFLCLMQVTSQGKGGKGTTEDWVVDLVVPEVRGGMREFGKVLANPDIIKIFHGAESDIVWLQQDFDLYVVNLFDTYHASKALEFPSHSLASLLSLYCDFTPDKRYQMADWRIRPLPVEMLAYARSDTHYLLFIFDSLLNALISRSSPRSSPTLDASLPPSTATPLPSTTPHLLRTVLQRSEDTCRRRYAREIYDSQEGSGPQGYRLLAKKWGKDAILKSPPFGSAARLEGFVFRRVHEWRDRVAREEDESTRWVLPNHQIFTLAGGRPTTVKGLMMVLQPMTGLVRERSEELVEVIRKAIEEGEGETGSGGRGGPTVTEMDVVEEKPVQAVTVVSGVWDMLTTSAPTAAVPVAPKSSLFGRTLPTKAAAPTPSASSSVTTTKSSLFGSSRAAAPKAAVAAPTPAAGRSSGFLAAMKRINLSINPPPPPPPPQVDPATLPAPESVPFVPASARLSAPTPVTAPEPAVVKPSPIPKKDDIVTVGQPKTKKRKTDTAEKVAAKPPASVDMEVDADEVEALIEGEEEKEKREKFDYATAPNGLDAPKGGMAKVEGALKSVKVVKKRKEKKPYVEFGDFKKPPMSMAEAKRGNKSMTFHN